mmetsp:Transcript_22049/g.44607  ORF Transcript_22049/g.44607 Transcript_22049/m.44607 type:complete len:188 (-) Transcript_22049:632-1195(-)|eukprot:CAMPEP_0183299480 /NCGR_PEP_ID=MMETSP0160_2-20130417/6204_1 /TAXON_ID=2839 ORGANISM="Odontella Sinensis, Strain Grunow 1884" /NCGR_SAMPLE_ID=MMETSP0160_2 /ASSEMBLY_ACC=CAM_ASM_000250 /LENGTH=187 /DNA_ID=CAMNT_0025461735 /DNA_START=97 /DNA_END=660 /DNA_ORIENTATION=-
MARPTSALLLLAALAVLLRPDPASAFAPTRPSVPVRSPFRAVVVAPSSSSSSSAAAAVARAASPSRLRAEGADDDEGAASTAPVPSEGVVEPSAATPAKVEEEDGKDYPLDVPSPILLASSMILAIASIGSIFELGGGNPSNGFATSAAISALGLPSCLFLFYAAIKKGAAETEEDDKRFLNERGRY